MATAATEVKRPGSDKHKVIVYCLGPIGGRVPINQLKTLVACEAMGVPYQPRIVEKPRDNEWLRELNPYILLPAAEDTATQANSEGGVQRIPLFDSTAIMLYLADKYDPEGVFRGRTEVERASVLCWLILYASGLCATGELWLKLQNNPNGIYTVTIERLVEMIHKEYDVLERRLSEPGQRFIGLTDRPSVADLAIHASANGFVTSMAGIDFSKWPRPKAWSETLSELPFARKATFVNNIYARGEEYVASLSPEARKELSHIQGSSYKLKAED